MTIVLWIVGIWFVISMLWGIRDTWLERKGEKAKEKAAQEYDRWLDAAIARARRK